MISFTVGDRGGSVGVGGKVVEFYGSIVQGLGHGVLLERWMPLGESSMPPTISKGRAKARAAPPIHVI